MDCGYLASDIILDCPDIELVAGPYTYQSSNRDDEPGGSDMEDGAGNWLGRARGLGGDPSGALEARPYRDRFSRSSAISAGPSPKGSPAGSTISAPCTTFPPAGSAVGPSLMPSAL